MSKVPATTVWSLMSVLRTATFRLIGFLVSCRELVPICQNLTVLSQEPDTSTGEESDEVKLQTQPLWASGSFTRGLVTPCTTSLMFQMLIPLSLEPDTTRSPMILTEKTSR